MSNKRTIEVRVDPPRKPLHAGKLTGRQATPDASPDGSRRNRLTQPNETGFIAPPGIRRVARARRAPHAADPDDPAGSLT